MTRAHATAGAAADTVRAAFLLRGVNVGGQRRVPMDALREVAAAVGLIDPRTYVASGNLVAGCEGDAQAAAAALEAASAARFGFAVDVIARDAAAWARYLAEDPFPDVDAPNRVMLYLPRRGSGDVADVVRDAVAALQARLAPGERVTPTVAGAWAYYPDGVGRTKLTPAAIDAAFGAPTTGRNQRTVAALGAMLGLA